MAIALPTALEILARQITVENEQYSQPVRTFLAGELRVVRTIQRLIVPEMLRRVART
jgi:hypothetical protein